ncbi:hypothetical protein [Xenorhabdus indica]|uniref:hypothetical protein n=1 Tax=Xenorhabdus indica TaxID=333964 RepID=UPI001656A33B|nr:hypothetical protein [Xenorhabdus indica]MBC8947352.1 hypothetical protein [Xenorhabdus indica]
MKEFKLFGLAEGLIGKSTVQAESIDDLFKKYNPLSDIRNKVTIQGNKVIAFMPCDG